MIGVVVAVVTGLLALVPLFATSERRRVLRYLQDESKLVDETKDEALQNAHRETALVTSQRYRDLVNLTKVDRLQAQLRLMIAPLYLSFLAAGSLIFFPDSITDSEQVAERLNLIGNILALVAASAALLQTARITSARREARQTAERNSALTRRAEAAEAKVEDAEAKVQKVRTDLRELRKQEQLNGTPFTMGGVSRLLEEIDVETEHGDALVKVGERVAAQVEKQRQAEHERRMATRRAEVAQRQREADGEQPSGGD